VNGWSASDYGIPQAVAASQTDKPISKEFPITAGGASRAFVVKLKVSAATVAAAITVKLQTAIGADWVDSKTGTVLAGAGNTYIKILADNTYMPLLNKGRVVLTTGIGDSATVTSVEILQEL
jgi:hypothetical protein